MCKDFLDTPPYREAANALAPGDFGEKGEIMPLKTCGSRLRETM